MSDEDASLEERLFRTLRGKWGYINLNEIATDLSVLLGLQLEHENPFLDPGTCEDWKNFIHKVKGIQYSYGGWMEDRSVVWTGHYHEKDHVLHLGTDFYVPEGTPVYLPSQGTLVHSFVDTDQNGGWGGKLIFRIGDRYAVFGHLTDIVSEIGLTYGAGMMVGKIAGADKNGGWNPHLHLQVMTKFDPNVDGYAKKYDGIELDFPNPHRSFYGD